jgi:hypothetical protein
MFAALIVASLTQATPTAADFFSLLPGTTRTFVDVDNEGTNTMTTDEVLEPITIGGKQAIPVVTRDQGKQVSTTYYHVDPAAVYLLGYNPKHLLGKPMPVLEFDGKPGKWVYSGTSSDDKNAEAIDLKCESKLTGSQDVLGQRRPTLEARVIATVGSGKNQETIEQVATYAAGVGLIELRNITRVVHNKPATETRRLTKLEGAKSNG